MNLLFLTLVEFDSLEEHNIYTDLLRVFVENGHEVCVISPTGKQKQKTSLITEDHVKILRLRVGNMRTKNLIRKGISTLLIETTLICAIKRFFHDIRFDLVMYSTPPITLAGAVNYVKKRDGAKSYLLLKDIFPQNAVDLGMMSKQGIKAPIYWLFRAKEEKLYALSDFIGCMSKANKEYLIKHNPGIAPDSVEVCPNSLTIVDKQIKQEARNAIRRQYGIPSDSTVFVYGGNLGKPQGIPFLIQCIEMRRNDPESYFLIIGSGTEYPVLKSYLDRTAPQNVKLMKSLPRTEYDRLAAACDVGLIVLDHRFTIPNFPSRLLSYMQAHLPVLACTDPNTDVGETIVNGGFGWWCESNDPDGFSAVVDTALRADRTTAGENSFAYFAKYYSAAGSYDTIMSHFRS